MTPNQKWGKSFYVDILEKTGKQTEERVPAQQLTLRKAMWILLLLLGTFLLVWRESPNYLFDDVEWIPLHTILESFSIVSSLWIFGVGWHSYSKDQSGNAVLLACGFLAVGLIDFAHVMSYPGMPDFVTPNHTQKSIYFGLAARFLGGVAILSAVLFPWQPFASKSIRHVFLAGSLTLVAFIYWLGLFHEDIIPEAYISGQGLTPFKIGAEYLVMALYALAAIILANRSRKSQPFHVFHVKNLLISAIVMVMAEMWFARYVEINDIFNFLGHVCKVVAYYFLYRAVFVENVRAPFQRLDQSERFLKKSAEWLFTTLAGIGDAVIVTDPHGRIDFMNPAAERVTGWTWEEAAGKDIKEIFRIANETTREVVESPVTKVLRDGIAVGGANHVVLIAKDGSEIPIDDSAAPIRNEQGSIEGVVLVFRDVTERKQAEERLRSAREQPESLVNHAADTIATFDPEGHVLQVNNAFEKTFGWPGQVHQVILAHQAPNGEVEYYSTIARGLADIKSSQEKERLAAKVFESVTEGILVTDANGTIVSVNPAFTEITGYSEEEAVGQKPSILRSGWHNPDFYEDMWTSLLETGKWTGEIWDRRKNGEMYVEEITISAAKDELGKTTHYVGVFKDITLRKKMEERIRYLACHDALTDLPNRTVFLDRLTQSIAHARRNQQMFAVLFLDLDRFKFINDMLGHSLGDLLLQEVAERLKRCVRESDTVSRLGGNEFVILLPDLSDREDAAQAAEKILEALSQPFVFNGEEYSIFASIGISLYPTDGSDRETLIQKADMAMYHAKEQGNHYQFYDSSMNVLISERLKLKNDMRKALEREEFVLHYQPKVDLNTGEIIGMEALVRWQHPELGMVSPGKFIPLAEETGLILPLGEWVLRSACLQNKAWQEADLPPVRVAVNLSMAQFQQKNLTETIARILKEIGLSPHFLELELTESMVIRNPETTIRILQELKEMGIQISLDDFGTGYSSLSYLKLLPLDTIKIDRSFIRNIKSNPDEMSIVRAVIDLAHSLKMKVITEGVETEEQIHVLRSCQCDEAQGYYFSPPVSAEEFKELLRKNVVFK